MKRFHIHSGIAIAPILFIVAVLAVLAVAIAAGTGSFSSDSKQEKARTFATSLINIGLALKGSFERLRANGTAFDSASLGNIIITYGNGNPFGFGYANVYMDVPGLGTSGCTSTSSKRGVVSHLGPSTDTLAQATCDQINTQLNNGVTPSLDAGYYATANTPTSCMTMPFSGKLAGCYYSTNATLAGYTFYQVAGVR